MLGFVGFNKLVDVVIQCPCVRALQPNIGLIFGSSRFTGEGGLDLQKEIG